MKLLSLQLLAASLHLAAGRPQDIQTTSTSAAAAVATGTTPVGCRALSKDSSYPARSAWSLALPGVEANVKNAADPNPDYTFIPTSYSAVQAAVNFVRKNNIRLSIINSGHDFLGRYVRVLNGVFLCGIH